MEPLHHLPERNIREWALPLQFLVDDGGDFKPGKNNVRLVKIKPQMFEEINTPGPFDTAKRVTEKPLTAVLANMG